jgi:hypothetical protein
MNRIAATLFAALALSAAAAAQAAPQEIVKLPRVVVTGKAVQVAQLPRVVVTGQAVREVAQLPRVVVVGYSEATLQRQQLAAAKTSTRRA